MVSLPHNPLSTLLATPLGPPLGHPLGTPLKARLLPLGLLGILTWLFAISASAQKTYTVRSGDTLTTVAKRFQCVVDELVAMNGLRSANAIKVGQQLRIPGSTVEYAVRKRESLVDISKRFNVSVEQIVRYNGLRDKNHILVGQKLKIPRNRSVVSTVGSSSSTTSAPRTYITPSGYPAAPAPSGEWRPVLPKPTPAWNRAPSLPAAVRATLDTIRLRRSPWNYIIIHHSGTSTGHWKGMDHHHRNERNMENGLAYHFVIHNGASGIPDGNIHIGDRWLRQLDGGHMKTDPLNHKCIGICLVGNFEKTRPTARQKDALVQLTHYLLKQTELSPDRVRGHGQENSVPTACPGKNFNLPQLVTQLKQYER